MSIAWLDPPAARAQDECGAGTAATCTSAGNTYPNGITYNNANQTVTLQSGVVVNTGTNVGVNLTGSGTQTLNIASGVTITTSGRDGVDIAGPTGSGAASAIIVSGAGSSVTTSGNLAWGYGLVSFGSIDATLGSVTVQGNNGVGIYAEAAGPIELTTGAITVGGNFTGSWFPNAIFATASGAGANGAITIDTTAGAVSLTGTMLTSHAIVASSSNAGGGGSVSITTADVSSTAPNAFAISASTNGTLANGAVTVDTTAGTITTIGSGSRGISAENFAAANGGLVQVLAGNVITSGPGSAHAIFASSPSGAVTVTAGDLSTAGNTAIGVTAAAGGTINVTTGDVTTTGTGTAHGIQAASVGAVTIDSTAGTISTVGANARGITVDRTGATATTINAGTILTTGNDGQGVHVISGTFGVGNGGAVTVTANSITTRGDTVSGLLGFGADAIGVITMGSGANGKVVIDTSVGALPNTLGSVSTEGDRAYGIRVQSGRPNIAGSIGGGVIEITAGDVTTTGDQAAGISAETEGAGANGTITIDVLGTISTKGGFGGGGQSAGVIARSWGGGPISITTHDIFTEGDLGNGISAQSGNGPVVAGGPPQVLGSSVTIDSTGGTIWTKGSAAHGIGIGSPSGVVTTTTGDIFTEGFGAMGIAASNSGPNSAMTIDTTAGTITTSGQNAHGINAITGSFGPGGGATNAGLLHIIAGDITATGSGSAAIVAGANNGSIDIDVVGDLSTGATGSHVVSIGGDGTTKTTIDVSGTVTAIATGAHAILASGPPGTSTNEATVSGTVSASGTGSAGIHFSGVNDKVTVAADGSVSGNDVGVQMQQNSGAAIVVNSGTITGTSGTAVRFLGNFASTFENYGTFNGNILMGGGADTVILGPTSVINGNINGQGGTDLLRLTGGVGTTASLDVTRILGFNGETGEKTGLGTWTLAGTSATFNPNFDIQQGLLVVDSNTPSLAVTVDAGASLGGSGTLGSFVASGTVAPGNSIGILNTVNGTFGANSFFEVEIDPANADRLVATGTVTIDPTAFVRVLALPGAYVAGTEYLILDANTRAGAFGGVVDNSAFLEFALDQTRDLDQVWLTITTVANFPVVANTPNQFATATALQALGSGPLFNAVALLDAATARFAFDQLSGELHPSLRALLLDEGRHLPDAVIARIRQAFADPGAGIPDGSIVAMHDDGIRGPLTLWSRAYGAFGEIEGDGNAAGLDRASGGIFLGGEREAFDDWRIGLVAGYSHSEAEVADRASQGSIDAAHIALYGGTRLGAIGVRLGGAYAWHGIETERTPAFPGFADRLTADYWAGTAQLFGEAGYELPLGPGSIEPFLQLRYINVATDGFTESGGPAALTADAEHEDILVTTLGIHAAGDFLLASGRRLVLDGTLGWRHALGDVTPETTFAFNGGAGAPFEISGVPVARHAALGDFGFSLAFGQARLRFGYSGQVAGSAQDHALTAGLGLSF